MPLNTKTLSGIVLHQCKGPPPRLLRRVAEAFKLEAQAAAELLPPKAQLALARFSPPSRAGQQLLNG